MPPKSSVRRSPKSSSEPALLLRGVARTLARRTEVCAGYVFGSSIGGRTHQASDVDVAVLLARDARRSGYLRIRLDLAAEIGAALGRSDVDVTILNEASPLLAHRVLSQGKMAFERSAAERVRFQCATARRYFDLLPTYEVYVRALKRLARRGVRG